MSEQNVNTLKTMHEKRLSETVKKTETVKKQKPSTNANAPSKSIMPSPKPSTSGVSTRTGGPIDFESSSGDESDDDEPCCVCKHSFPPQLRGCPYLVIVKWGQCDICGHWVHLTHCTEIRVLRRGSTFRCIHCPEE